ncbi:MAG: antitoxin Xre/MbcA/ParS toxin-binding domain-containing protein [Halofilum sp. (in: g-proteobacteria)]|nr:antitoxin Xre/MbcA/ParS toxin-binding domain-containing protein [Halofilum sp. (in: g-proteobacteria)]
MAEQLITHPADFSPDARIAGFRAALRILGDVWELADDETAAILDTTSNEIHAWREAPTTGPITDDRLTRASYVLGIHKALDTLVPDRSAHPGFIRRSLPALDGATPLDIMSDGVAGLRRMRGWLDGECQC